MGLGLRRRLLCSRSKLDQTVQYSSQRLGTQPPPQDRPARARNMSTRSLQAPGPAREGRGSTAVAGLHQQEQGPRLGTRAGCHPPPTALSPPQACGRNRKDQLTWASSSQSLRALPLLPQTAFSQGHLIFALPPNCQLVVTQTSTTITLMMLPCGRPSLARKTEVP